MPIYIRRAKISDYKPLMDIYKELDDLHYKEHPNRFVKPLINSRPVDHIKSIISSNDIYISVAVEREKIVGFAEAYVMHIPPSLTFKARSTIFIENIAVLKSHQHEGIGKRLLNDVKKWAEEKNIKTMELSVFHFNKQAYQFYKKNGFKTLQQIMTYTVNEGVE